MFYVIERPNALISQSVYIPCGEITIFKTSIFFFYFALKPASGIHVDKKIQIKKKKKCGVFEMTVDGR